MSELRKSVWDLPSFLEWEADQEERYELDAGEPRLMTGGSQAHALVASRLLALLWQRLEGRGCRPYGSDLRVPIPATGNCRYPDVTIDCGAFDPIAREASGPTVIFEVLSPSTAWFDQTRKLRDYESLPSLRQYVLVSQSELRVDVWRRGERGRFEIAESLTECSQSLSVETCETPIPLEALYAMTGLCEAAAPA
ncbi:MAG: Uma2 family endonuclease [Pseudomonadota bacterium]|nr:Uma2 family endonuclease [Pseudomonadota bacterium]